ncbi:hypothetical protein [Aphanothece sacrum]|nr:hypothetical protein [Aphanothece sacrum]
MGSRCQGNLKYTKSKKNAIAFYEHLKNGALVNQGMNANFSHIQTLV